MKIYYNPNLKQKSRELRNKSTVAEVLLWNELKGKKLMGYQFMRQKPIGNAIVDFYCTKLKLVIEIDGDSHVDNEIPDKERQEDIEKRGIHFLRFSDLEVKSNLDGVIKVIMEWIENKDDYTDNPCCPFKVTDIKSRFNK